MIISEVIDAVEVWTNKIEEQVLDYRKTISKRNAFHDGEYNEKYVGLIRTLNYKINALSDFASKCVVLVNLCVDAINKCDSAITSDYSNIKKSRSSHVNTNTQIRTKEDEE